MSINYFDIFKKIIKEEETVVTKESDKDKILRKSPKIRKTLSSLLSSQKSNNDSSDKELNNLISDIKVIAYKPSTFRIILTNSNHFDLIYDPTPQQLKHKDQFEDLDFFTCRVAGKKYFISNNSEFEQAIDAINKAMRENPIGSAGPGEEPGATDQGSEELPAEETPEEGGEDQTDKEQDKEK